jgi:hypothetical protein
VQALVQVEVTSIVHRRLIPVEYAVNVGVPAAVYVVADPEALVMHVGQVPLCAAEFFTTTEPSAAKVFRTTPPD